MKTTTTTETKNTIIEIAEEEKTLKASDTTMTQTIIQHLDHPPKQVLQTDFKPGTGNALQACVASLFHQDLKDTPNFITLGVNYEKGLQDFVQPFNYAVVKWNLLTKPSLPSLSPSKLTPDVGTLGILRGKSPRGTFAHVVVARWIGGEEDDLQFEWIWDPHPEATFLDRKEPYGWFMYFPKQD